MIDQWVKDASVAQAQGRFPEAEALALRALESEPENTAANVIVGMIEARAGRTTQAIERFGAVRRREPRNFDAVMWLSMLYRMVGSPQDAIEFAELAIRARPQEAHTHSNLGLCLLAIHELDRAIPCFEKAISLNPKVGQNFHHLGMALQLQARDDEAVVALRRSLSLNPNSLATLLALGQSQMNLMDTVGAIDSAEKSLRLNPKSAAAHLLWSSALIAEGKSVEAESHIRSAVSLEPRDSNAQAMLGMRLQALGRLEEANECFRTSIEAVPEQGFAYLALMRNHKVGEADRETLTTMEELTRKESIPLRGQSFLHYGLGKAYEDLKDFEKAMQHFDEANRIGYRLRFGNRAFSKRRYSEVFDWSIKTFTPEFFERYRSVGLDTDSPVFIVGMMRSGTTLVEQILSSHPEVDARGEQPFWMTRRTEPLSVGTSKLDAPSLQKLAGKYLESMRSMGEPTEKFTDKMPDNFITLGLIHLAFPNARFIHTKRHPVDTCISIYTTPNRTAVEYANNRENIVFAYQQYERLMAHWQSVIPPDRLLEVQYEELISDREALTRKMVDFCGLPWNDACLHPEANERTVATPSVWQVRQPVYNSSVERWHGYRPWLGVFALLLPNQE